MTVGLLFVSPAIAPVSLVSMRPRVQVAPQQQELSRSLVVSVWPSFTMMAVLLTVLVATTPARPVPMGLLASLATQPSSDSSTLPPSSAPASANIMTQEWNYVQLAM